METCTPVLGIIGGSGLYDIPGLKDPEWREISSPFGEPSDAFLFAEIGDMPVVFLPRHGRGHRISPTDINYRANIDAMKRAGVTEIVSLSAVGSLKEDLAPGTFVLVDQFIDRTFARAKTFFGTGLVAHVALADPVCPRLGDALEGCLETLSVPYRRGGTYVAMEGPQFSTRAESELYRSWGASVIGMTNMPEAKLAREAEICYATVAMVTDYDCWHDDHDAVTVEQIVRVLHANADAERSLVAAVAPRLLPTDGPQRPLCEYGCQTALDTALITAPDARSSEMLAKLDAILARMNAAQA